MYTEIEHNDAHKNTIYVRFALMNSPSTKCNNKKTKRDKQTNNQTKSKYKKRKLCTTNLEILFISGI